LAAAACSGDRGLSAFIMNTPKLKVLFHLPCALDPIDTGAKQRMIGLLHYFKRRQEYCDLDVVSAGDWDRRQREQVAALADKVYVYDGHNNWGDAIASRSQSLLYQRILRRQLPIDATYFTPPGYRRFVKAIADRHQYDVVLINYLDYAHLALGDAFGSAAKVIDIHDIACRIRLARKGIAYLSGLRFDYEQNFRREVRILQKFDHVLINSLDELSELEPHIPASQLTLIPHLLKGLPDADRMPDYASRSMQYDLLFVGAPYGPNVDGMNFFLAQVFPQIIECCPMVKLVIVGKVGDALDIPEAVSRNVDCLGFVPDLGAMYLASRIVICPLLSGSGTKVKLQEAMAYGVPIVTTSVGASGLAFEDGVNADIQDNPQAFADSVVALLQDRHRAQEYSQNVLLTFQDGYTEQVIYARLDQIFGLQPPMFEMAAT
jgi:glycosyltransferase involved in cell wall biosynthesis